MDTIYWHINTTQGGANLHLGVNLHSGANCAYEHGFSLAQGAKHWTYVVKWALSQENLVQAFVDNKMKISLAFVKKSQKRFPLMRLKQGYMIFIAVHISSISHYQRASLVINLILHIVC